MAYGTLKCDNITFTNGGVDQTVTVSGVVQSISGNITATGTIQGQAIIGTSTVSGATVTGDAGSFTTLTGGSAGFTTITGATVTGTTANFVNGTFSTQVSGTTVRGTTVSGATVTGAIGQFTTLTGGTAGFTTVTGTTVTGTTANFQSGVFTTQISGATVTGNVGSFSTITGGTVTLTSGVFGTGTAAAPSIAFTGDTNTGIYSPGADQLALSTNGTGRLFVDASGRVGVGVGSPSTPLDIASVGAEAIKLRASTSPATGQLLITDNSNTSTWFRVSAEATETQLYTFGSSALRLGTNATERLRITSAGLVGIGTSSPGKLLDLQASSNLAIRYYNGATFRAGTEVATNAGDMIGTSAASDFCIRSQSNLLFSAGGNTEALRIDSSARVGIGTTSPIRLLSVSNGGAEGFEFGPGDTAGINLTLHYNRSTSTYIGSVNQANYHTWSAGGAAEKMRIDSSGRLLVGASSAPTFASNSLIYVEGSDLVISSSNGQNINVFTSNSQAAGLGGGISFGGRYEDGGAQYQFGAIKGVKANSTSGNAEGNLIFSTTSSTNTPTERLRIDSSGRLLVGTSSSRLVGSGSAGIFQVEQAAGNISASIVNNYAGAPGAILSLGHSRSTSIGSNTLLQANDSLGEIRFAGADGVDIRSLGASIAAEVDGTPGADDMPGRLLFSTTADGASSPTERMRIDNNGQVQIGRTSPVGNERLALQTNGAPCGYFFQGGNANHDVLELRNTYNQSGQTATYIRFSDFGGTTRGSITATTSATSYNTSSDYRLKESVIPVTDGITRLQQLKPSRFNFIVDPGTVVDGFVAHEVQTIVPEAITGEKDAVDDEGNPIYQGIDQSKLVPLLTAALQEAVAKIESLEARLAAAGI